MGSAWLTRVRSTKRQATETVILKIRIIWGVLYSAISRFRCGLSRSPRLPMSCLFILSHVSGVPIKTDCTINIDSLQIDMTLLFVMKQKPP